MDVTEKALVLRVGRFREADAWVRLLSPSKGLYTAFAFGGLKSRRRFVGCLDPLNLVLFTVGSDRRGAYLQLREGSLISGFPELRSENSLLGQAVNCIKFVEAIEPGPDDGRAVFELLVQVLEALTLERPGGDLFPLLFRARMAFEIGFHPDMRVCSVCGRSCENEAGVFFNVESGRIRCAACKSSEKPVDGLSRPISIGALRMMDWIMTSTPSDWVGLGMSSDVRRQVYETVELFVAYHLDLQWEGGNYKKV